MGLSTALEVDWIISKAQQPGVADVSQENMQVLVSFIFTCFILDLLNNYTDCETRGLQQFAGPSEQCYNWASERRTDRVPHQIRLGERRGQYCDLAKYQVRDCQGGAKSSGN